MDTPLVSVIVIFLNAERFLREALESVFAQTYKNWELLLIDDGSIDAGTQIARTLAAQNPGRVKYLKHPDHKNRGKGASRNLGIQHARGEWITFLDADDVWLPNKLEEQVAILSSEPEAGMVYGLDQYWYSWTGKAEDQHRDFIPRLGVPANSLIPPPRLLPQFLRGKAAIPCPNSILIRREIAERVGGFEEAFRGISNVYEDQAFYAKVCLRTSIIAADLCWDKYRQHPDASCAVAQKTGQEYSARLFFLNWLEEYLSEHGISDSGVWRSLKKALWLHRHSPYWPKSAYNITRWIKKWLLRLEERITPEPISRRLWSRKDKSGRRVT
ncbi:MAG: glycosyltransferase family 2 protein [Planctomycetota bacterium]|jgi:glycosyltransferase involved in cell wall biosynthesis